MIDRVAPTRRPLGRAAGYQRWRSLLFMHWDVPVDVLRAAVPAELELDLFDGEALLGVVPFKMEHVRPWWWPKRCAMNFLETNLRTYVVHNGRPGVYFFSLEATSRLAVLGARIGWNLPYYFVNATMNDLEGTTTYETRRPSSGVKHLVRYRIGDELASSEVGTLQYFLLERYLLFVQRRGKMYSGQVFHSPYPAFDATVEHVEDELIAAAGFAKVVSLPRYSHYSPGVDVEVFPLEACV